MENTGKGPIIIIIIIIITIIIIIIYICIHICLFHNVVCISDFIASVIKPVKVNWKDLEEGSRGPVRHLPGRVCNG